MDEPMLRAYLPDATAAPVRRPDPRPLGRRDLMAVPRRHAEAVIFGAGGLHRPPQAAGDDLIRGEQHRRPVHGRVGSFRADELPREQSLTTRRSLVFDTAPLYRRT